MADPIVQETVEVVDYVESCWDCDHAVSRHSERDGFGCHDCDCQRFFVVYPPKNPETRGPEFDGRPV